MIIRTNKTFLVIFTISLLIYLLSCFGVFDSLSASFSKFLYNSLGYTNRWSKTFGPIWFVRMNGDISALGSRELVLLFSVIMYFYLKLTRGKSDARRFLFTVGLGIIVILVTKSITSKHDDLNFNSILVESLSNFPSGHTFIATVLYFTIAQHLTSKKNSSSINKYLLITASVFSLMVGVSRFMGNGHTVTEVIAGWSLGLCWFTFAQMFLNIDHKKIFNK
jgi:undecaprenyl-diphosphatase